MDFWRSREDTERALMLTLSSVGLFSLLAIVLFIQFRLETTTDFMRIAADIFLASAAISSFYIANKSLEHDKSVQPNAKVVNYSDERDNQKYGVKVFNLGNNPIISQELVYEVVAVQDKYLTYYLRAANEPKLIPSEDSRIIGSANAGRKMWFDEEVKYEDYRGEEGGIEITENVLNDLDSARGSVEGEIERIVDKFRKRSRKKLEETNKLDNWDKKGHIMVRLRNNDIEGPEDIEDGNLLI